MRQSAFGINCGWTARLVFFAALFALAGCRRSTAPPSESQSATEATLAEQAAAVRAGDRDVIRLDHTLVRDPDLAPLDGMHDRLRRINLSHTEITDAGLARIAACKKLVQLRLSSPRVTDAGMADIGGLTDLRFLHLLDMPITDAGLDQLHGLKNLESLYLDQTQVSDAGLERLLAALGDVHLHIDDHHHPLDKRGTDHMH